MCSLARLGIAMVLASSRLSKKRHNTARSTCKVEVPTFLPSKIPAKKVYLMLIKATTEVKGTSVEGSNQEKTTKRPLRPADEIYNASEDSSFFRV